MKSLQQIQEENARRANHWGQSFEIANAIFWIIFIIIVIIIL